MSSASRYRPVGKWTPLGVHVSTTSPFIKIDVGVMTVGRTISARSKQHCDGAGMWRVASPKFAD